MSLIVIDYGMSNLGSIRRSFEECGADVIVSDDPQDLKLASHIVLPGVGSFSDGMINLQKKGWVHSIKEAVVEKQIPLLGICLGMQLLADKGYEGGNITGLELIHGEVKKLETNSQSERIPHVGWNEIIKNISSPLFYEIPDRSDFYFVHSYHFIPNQRENILAFTPYCDNFVSAVVNNNVYGVQFHPEKSGRFGMRLLKNFINI